MALPAGRYGVTKKQLNKIKNLPIDTIGMIEGSVETSEEYTDDSIGWGSKNKLQIPDSIVTTTTQGITFTVNRNDNGEVTSIVANGTATADSTLRICNNVNLSAYNGYKLTGCPSGGSTSKYLFGIQPNISPYTTFAIDIGEGDVIANVPNDNTCQAILRIKSGQTVSNLTFYPMISKDGGVFEPYHANVADSLAEKADISALGTQEGATASRLYHPGEHFYKDGQSCKVIGNADVAQGATWTLNTNYKVKSVYDSLVKKATFSGTTGTTGLLVLTSDNSRTILGINNLNQICFFDLYQRGINTGYGIKLTALNGNVLESTEVSGEYYYIDN